MVTEQTGYGYYVEEEEEETPRRAEIAFDERLGPTCMVWLMAIVLGTLALIMIVWGISNFGNVFR